MPNTISNTPMSFTQPSGDSSVHDSRQMRFVRHHAQASAPVRLFCFPHAGGTAASYTGWTRALETSRVEVVAAQLPGRGLSGEAPCRDLEQITATFADAIAPLLDRPYAFFGHSLGAIVAFELTRVLRSRRLAEPHYLFVSGAYAPQISSVTAPLRSVEGDTEFLEAVAAKYGGVPKIVLEQADLRASIVPALRADLALTETYVYRHEPPLACPIAAYAGTSDPIVTADGLSQWREQTTAGFSCRLFNGHHFYLNRERDALLADVTGRLLRCV